MYEEIITEASKKYSVDPALIKAVIMTESSWDPQAYRYEPRIKDTSYGLMQVLLKTARGIAGNAKITAGQLFQPSLNILIGTKYLSQLKSQYRNMEDVIASYNAGAPYKKGGKYTNQSYVDKVKGWHTFYRTGPYGLPFLLIVGGGAYYFLRRSNKR